MKTKERFLVAKYVDFNPKTKKALKEAVAAGQRVMVFQVGPFAEDPTTYTGEIFVEGPHYPKPHTWYGKVQCEAGVVTKVLA